MTTPLSADEKNRYHTINKENLDFLMNRYNRVNRWVIADMIRRSRYHYPDKVALIYNDQTLTYSQLEDAANQVANALTAIGIQKYDRVAILAHNTVHHVLTWLACCKIGAIYLAINYLLKGKDISTVSITLRASCLSSKMPCTVWLRMSWMTCRRLKI